MRDYTPIIRLACRLIIANCILLILLPQSFALIYLATDGTTAEDYYIRVYPYLSTACTVIAIAGYGLMTCFATDTSVRAGAGALAVSHILTFIQDFATSIPAVWFKIAISILVFIGMGAICHSRSVRTQLHSWLVAIITLLAFGQLISSWFSLAALLDPSHPQLPMAPPFVNLGLGVLADLLQLAANVCACLLWHKIGVMETSDAKLHLTHDTDDGWIAPFTSCYAIALPTIVPISYAISFLIWKLTI